MNITLITDKAEKQARVTWSLIAEPQDPYATEVISDLGYVDALDAVTDPQRADELAERDEVARAAVAGWRLRLPDARRSNVLLQVERQGVHLVDPLSVAGLGDLQTPPHVLYVRGDVEALAGSRALGWAGARASSAYGEHVTGGIVAELAAEGTPVHTGGAYGIDAAAVRAALRVGGRTAVWLAGGVDRSYPAGHTSMFDQVAATKGCAVVSELPVGASPTKWRFVSRSRLIAAAARATVIAEAGARSGTLVTGRFARELGRGLGAVPGPITSAASAGCHAMMRQFDARVITSAADVRELLAEADVVAASAEEVVAVLA